MKPIQRNNNLKLRLFYASLIAQNGPTSVSEQRPYVVALVASISILELDLPLV